MAEAARHARTPLVLIINDQEWSTRSLESILSPSGYAVLRAYTAAQGLERAATASPDIVIIAAALPDADGIEVCRRLRTDGHLTDSTPILLTATSRPPRTERLAAIRLGAWDYLSHPLDAEEILLRFHAYVRAKQDADRARQEGLVDVATGLYSVSGLARRARELGSLAFRQHGPLACVVVSAETDGLPNDLLAVVGALSGVLRNVGRASDVVGRIGELEFAVFAPETGVAGAQGLARRLTDQVQADPALSRLRVTSGYHAVEDLRLSGLEPGDLLEQATAALRASRGAARALS